MNELSEKAKELKKAYAKQWRTKNPDKVKQNNINYWERKAAAYSVDQNVIDLRTQGFSQRQIAKELNISLGAVNKILNSQ